MGLRSLPAPDEGGEGDRGAGPAASRPRSRWRRQVPYVAYRAGSVVARVLPAPTVVPLTRVAGALMAQAMADRRRMLARHLRRVHGPAFTGRALDREVRRAFASYARYWAESFRLPGTDPATLSAGMTWEGMEHLEAGAAAGKGVILAVPHLGCWDFGGAWIASLGHRLTTVVEPVEPPELFEWFATLRRSMGMEVLALDSHAGAAMLRRLSEGAVAALVCDRDLGGGGVEVEFFGERTTLPAGPATLALRSGAALVPSAVFYGGPRGHHAVMRPPLDTVRRGRLREDVARVTQDLAHELERSIRRDPEQWHLLQPNWPSDRS